MANISSAQGTYTFRSPDKLALHRYLIDFVTQLSNVDYGTDLLHPETSIPLNRETIEQMDDRMTFEDNLWTVTYDFLGSGRWSYQNNLEWTFNDLIETEEHFEEWESVPFDITVDYWDEEGGCGFLTHRIANIKWYPKSSNHDAYQTIDTLLEDYFDYTAENLIEYMDYDPNSIYDYDRLEKDLAAKDKTIIHLLRENLKSVDTDDLQIPTEVILANQDLFFKTFAIIGMWTCPEELIDDQKEEWLNWCEKTNTAS